MNEKVTSLRDKAGARWTALVLASLAIFGAYYFNYALSAVKPMLESILGWNSGDFGTYTSAYAWFNVFLFMLIFSGMILDKLGVRKTGLGATVIMFVGTGINYWAVSHNFVDGATVFGLKAQVFWSAFGFAIFGVGTEAIGITISKAVVRWFKGKELALAMGMQMAVARLGTLLALAISIPLAKGFGLTAPILFALAIMLLGITSFIVFSILDIRLDKSEAATIAKAKAEANGEDDFKVSDILLIITNKGFWYIALLCVLFYSAVFPFLFYATDLMINKYNVAPSLAGLIPSLLPFGTILLTPLFGGIYDKKGKGATIMIIGAFILILVHGTLALPFLDAWWIAAIMVIILGIAFSLVPSAMWPSVPKIIPEKQLGTAYAVIFWIQNIGLMGIPLMLGIVLNNSNPDVAPNKQLVKHSVENTIEAEMTALSFSEEDISFAITEITSNIVDSVVQYGDYVILTNSKLDTTQIMFDLETELSSTVASLNLSNDEESLNKIINNCKTAGFDKVISAQLNLKYDYQNDLLIFVTLSLLALIFGFLLKREDRIKDYGLEKPNIDNSEKSTEE